jgi:hypothetical protein
MGRREKFVLRAMGKTLGTITPRDEIDFQRKYNKILAKEFEKRHAISLVKVIR